MVKLTATKSFRYGGRPLLAGDGFEAKASDARLLKAIGKAQDADPEAEVEVEADTNLETETEPQGKKPGRGRYARRDMRADG